MQIEIAPDIEARILAEARQRGLSVPKLLEQLVTGQAAEQPIAFPGTQSERHFVIEDHIAWMKRTSPNWETADPYAVDWQAVKSEGRKY